MKYITLLAICFMALTGCEKDMPILKDPDERLRKPSAIVTNVNDLKLLDEMKSIMENENILSLGAPQLGENKRFFIVSDKDKLIEMVNPSIVFSSGEKPNMEESISVPGVAAVVARSEMVQVEYQDRKLQKKRLEATGTLAATIQQQIDHLNGVLIYDVAKHVMYKGD